MLARVEDRLTRRRLARLSCRPPLCPAASSLARLPARLLASPPFWPPARQVARPDARPPAWRRSATHPPARPFARPVARPPARPLARLLPGCFGSRLRPPSCSPAGPPDRRHVRFLEIIIIYFIGKHAQALFYADRLPACWPLGIDIAVAGRHDSGYICQRSGL